MGEAKTLAVNLDQLRGNATALHSGTSEAMTTLEQIASGSVAPGFAALAVLFDEVGAAGTDMVSAWGQADTALKARLEATAANLHASADQYQAVDAAKSKSLTLDVETQR